MTGNKAGRSAQASHACRAREGRESLSPVLLSIFSLAPDLLLDCSKVLEYAKIQTVLQSTFFIDKQGCTFIEQMGLSSGLWLKDDHFSNSPYACQGANQKVSFTACHQGNGQLACTSPQVISTSPKTLFDKQD